MFTHQRYLSDKLGTQISRKEEDNEVYEGNDIYEVYRNNGIYEREHYTSHLVYNEGYEGNDIYENNENIGIYDDISTLGKKKLENFLRNITKGYL